MSVINDMNGYGFQYIPQVETRFIMGKGWLKEGEESLISRENIWNINDVIRFAKKCDFRHERISETYWTIRWFYLPQSYLFEMRVNNVDDFGILCDQFERYLKYLKTEVYPTYRKSDKFIQWDSV